MPPRIIAIAVALLSGGFCLDARAQITAFWQAVPITPQAIADDPQLANMQSWDLVTTTTGDWSVALMRAVLPQTLSFYRHPLAGLTRPDPAIVTSSPALEFTSYVTAPSDDGSDNGTRILGGHPQGQPPNIGDPTSAFPGVFSMVWADQFIVDLPGTYPIARLTFPEDALPNVLNNTPVPINDPSVTIQVSPDATVVIPEVPEPSILGWLAGAQLLVGQRSRLRMLNRGLKSCRRCNSWCRG